MEHTLGTVSASTLTHTALLGSFLLAYLCNSVLSDAGRTACECSGCTSPLCSARFCRSSDRSSGWCGDDEDGRTTREWEEEKGIVKIRVWDANEDNSFFKVTDCSMVEVRQYISAVTYDPSAHTTRCSYRWLQLHKENLVGRRTNNRNTRGRKETKTEFVRVLLPLRGKVIKQKSCEINSYFDLIIRRN